ncbi:MAG: hypothetical protein ACYCUG_06670 [Acidimicrobiales bacterium]
MVGHVRQTTVKGEAHHPGDDEDPMLTMNQYVGTAKFRPASRIPRMLPWVSSATNRIDRGTGATPVPGQAERTASTPVAMDTATVRV